jgi:hypothetical protein
LTNAGAADLHNRRDSVLTNLDSAAQMLREIETAARSAPAWVTIPVRETNPPKALLTSNVECFLEVPEIPGEDPERDGAAAPAAASSG